MAELNLTELRKVAEAADPGPWEVRMGYVGANRVPFVSLPKCDGIRVPREPDAQHMAAFDPPTALALLDRVAELETVVGRVEALLAKELLDDLASDIYRARANVRCLDCNIRYEERQDYGCFEGGRGHDGFTDDMLADAVEEARAEFATTAAVRFDLVELTAALAGESDE